MTARLNRRRFITIAAAATGFSLSRGLAAREPEAARLFVTRGSALGAEATIALAHRGQAEAAAAARLCLSEIERLERIFSLYRADSALVALNRDGHLDHPPPELVELLTDAQRFGTLSGGAFDVTVQPLWRLDAEHFARAGADPKGPDTAARASARALVDYRRIDVTPARIAFERPGMAVTLNGIAQGYITDRIAALLADQGFDNVMLDLGEIRAIGTPPGETGWRIGLRDPLRPDATFETLRLSERAVASSGGYGCAFDSSGRHHHIFDPHTGESAQICRGVSVIAARATLADALSTAFSVMAPAQAEALALRLGDIRVILTLMDGARRTLNAPSAA